jgi:hypothetical protein
MTINEYEKKLKKLNDKQFNKFKTDFGGDYKTREEYVRNFVDNPKHERRICQLLGLQTEEEKISKATRRSVLATIFSTLIALVAVTASIVIHSQTRNLIKPTERPVLVITESKSTISKGDGKADTLLVDIKFENIGKHPARDLKTVIWFTPHSYSSDLEYVSLNQKIFANVVYPGTNFCWLSSIPLKPPVSEKPWYGDFLFCIGLNYTDDYTYKRYPSEYLYYVYDARNNVITHADIGERDIMIKHLKPGMEKWLVE